VGPWIQFDADDGVQYVLTLGIKEDESFFQVAKLLHNIYVVEAYAGTWVASPKDKKLTLTINKKWDGVQVTTTGYWAGTVNKNLWVDVNETWTLDYKVSGKILTVTTSSAFAGGVEIELTKSEELVHFCKIVMMD